VHVPVVVERFRVPSANPGRPRDPAFRAAVLQNKHMSDPAPSGAPLPDRADPSAPAPAPAGAPVAASAAPAQPAPAFGSFGATRGTGLARGKRPQPASAGSAAPAAPAGYKPSSLEVITPKSEFKNPFTGEVAVTTPRANEPELPPAPPPAAPAPVAIAPAPVPAPAPAPTPAPAAPVAEEKAELKIIPPEAPRRSEVRWETPAPGARREDRPHFQTSRERRETAEGREGGRGFEPREGREGREGRRFEPREPREQREPREGRRDDRRGEGRGPRHPAPEPTPAPAPEKRGFFGWLKGLFRRKPKPAAPAEGEARFPHGDRHRSHGGRQDRGPRPEGQDGYDGPRRRRRRGGRGRNRGDRGDRGPRPEGQQGGGAI